MKNLEKKIYSNIFRIRFVEESIAKEYKTGDEGLMRCPVHLSTGQDLSAVFQH